MPLSIGNRHVPITSQVVLMVENPPTNAGDARDVSLTPGSGREGPYHDSRAMTISP